MTIVKADTGREYMNQVLKSTGHTQAHAPKSQCHWKGMLCKGHSDLGRLLMGYSGKVSATHISSKGSEELFRSLQASQLHVIHWEDYGTNRPRSHF